MYWAKIQHIEGIDVIFMGLYNKDYKPELDDVLDLLLAIVVGTRLRGGRTKESNSTAS